MAFRTSPAFYQSPLPLVLRKHVYTAVGAARSLFHASNGAWGGQRTCRRVIAEGRKASKMRSDTHTAQMCSLSGVFATLAE